MKDTVQNHKIGETAIGQKKKTRSLKYRKKK